MRRGQVAVCLATVMGRVPYGSSIAAHAAVSIFRGTRSVCLRAGHLAYYRILCERGDMRCLSNASNSNNTGRLSRRLPRSVDQPIGIIIAMEGAIRSVNRNRRNFGTGRLARAEPRALRISRICERHGGRRAVDGGGRELLERVSRLGMVLDMTHLCDQSFWQAMDHFDGPLLASHQNCRSSVPGQRQFSDEQIGRLTDRGGIVGIAFDAWMMYPGWELGTTQRDVVSIDAAIDHIDHICQLAGNDQHVAIGSDLDGGFGTEQTPTGLDTIADLQKLAPLHVSARV